MRNPWQHQSVLLKEVLDFLNVKKGHLYVDATLGAAGHAKEIIKQGGQVIGFEVDPKTVEKLEEEALAGLTIINKNFSRIGEILREKGITSVSGVLFDLGISSDQLSDPSLGLSFNLDAPLDMRLDPNLGVSAADLINALAERELYELFDKYGEEHSARRLARAIVDARREEKIQTSYQLVKIINRVVGARKGRLHPATKVFMALRIAVNSELENLEEGLRESLEVLEKGGKLLVISFHSLEDRIVKRFFQDQENLKIITKNPVLPSEEEVERNPRARSAKLRVAEKI
ncbi:MAG: 16S rRNA (cytosine(1402)-N(4))-methyltransferase RsmH [bacterium]|nr:16S rRNA (cytosine(1402)-N(4))-methyltransferase RsmH [bacterium]